jgi:hypothetical protein
MKPTPLDARQQFGIIFGIPKAAQLQRTRRSEHSFQEAFHKVGKP